MKKLLVLAAACGVTLMLASGAALAQDQDHGNDWGHDHDRHHQDDGHHGRGHDDDRGHGHGHGHYESWHDRGMHEGWYKRGGYLPAEYRSPRYVVYDWRADHLRAPPPGYRWVRSDTGDFLLVAVTTGVIVDLLLNH